MLVIVAVYAGFSFFQSEGGKAKAVSATVLAVSVIYLCFKGMIVADVINGYELLNNLANGLNLSWDGVKWLANILGVDQDSVAVNAPIFQQFNPFYVVALTPVSLAIFGALAKRGKEPSAPRKIAYGMLVAAVGFSVMAYGSMGLNTPDEQNKRIVFEKAEALAVGMSKAQSLEDEKAKTEAVAKATADKNDFVGTYEDILKDSKDKEEIAEANEILALFNDVYTAKEQSLAGGEEKEAADAKLAEINAQIPASTRVSPYWLILTYLILTFAELLLSPMGISFVSKVAPPKYKGMMMGGWFVATAIGNFLVAVGGLLWGGFSLTVVWSVFIVLCLLSALFMFVMMKRLESATK